MPYNAKQQEKTNKQKRRKIGLRLNLDSRIKMRVCQS